MPSTRFSSCMHCTASSTVSARKLLSITFTDHFGRASPCFADPLNPMLVQIGAPASEVYRVILCNSLNASNPLPFQGAASDCWLQCSAAATISPAANAWLQGHVRAAVDQFKGFLGLLWCGYHCFCHVDSTVPQSLFIEPNKAV